MQKELFPDYCLFIKFNLFWGFECFSFLNLKNKKKK